MRVNYSDFILTSKNMQSVPQLKEVPSYLCGPILPPLILGYNHSQTLLPRYWRKLNELSKMY